MADGPERPAPRTALGLLRRCVARRFGVLAVAVLGSLGHAGAQLATPLVARAGIDAGIRGGGRLWPYAAALLGIALLRGGFGAMRKYNASRLGALLASDLRAQLFAHLQRLSITARNRFGQGQLMSRAASDATVVDATCSGLPWIVQAVVMSVGAAVLMVLIQPLLALAVIATVALCAAAPFCFLRPMHRRSRAVQNQMGAVAQFVEQQVRGIRVVRGHGLEAVQQQAGRGRIEELRRLGLGLVAMRAVFTAAFVAVPSAAMITCIGLGGWMTFEGRLTPGGLLAFLQYLGVLVAIVPAVSQVVTIWPQALAALGRIDEVLRTAPDVRDPARPRPLPAGNGTVELRGVVAGYGTGRPALDGLHLHLEAGSSLALVGASGSGKSTVALLLARFLDPWHGDVLLDGTPARELRLADLRRQVAIVFEDGPTLGLSVRDNIALGRPGATDAEIVRAAQLAQADDFIRALPDGYETVLGEDGLTLSGGQRQRVAIARALLQTDARLLVLDDATSALDPATQAAIVDALRIAMRGRTTLITTHRAEMARIADEVAVLADGRVVDRGPAEVVLGTATVLGALQPVRREAVG